MARSAVSDAADFEAMIRQLQRRIEILERRPLATVQVASTSPAPTQWARISRATSLVIPNASNSLVTFTDVEFDHHGMTDAIGSALTAQVSGYYDCSYTIVYSDTTGTFRVATWMETSRDPTRYGETYVSAHNPGAGLAASETIWLGAGQYVKAATYHNRGTTYDIVAARLSAALVREAATP